MRTGTTWKVFGLYVVVIAAIGAAGCGPIVPSVSKLSSAMGGQKTPPTGGSSPGDNLSAGSPLLPPGTSDDESMQETHLVNADELDAELAQFRPRYHMSLDKHSLARFKKAIVHNDPVSFVTTHVSILGAEETLAHSKRHLLRVYLLVGDSAESLAASDKMRAQLSWDPGKVTESGRWKLELATPAMSTGNDVLDVEAERIRRSLSRDLIGVTFAFIHINKLIEQPKAAAAGVETPDNVAPNEHLQVISEF